MNLHKTSKIRQSGNILFFILIAVALFGALSYTVANMMRGGGNPSTIHTEKANLYVSEIIDYARSLRGAVQNIRINGCDDLDISFANNTVSGYEHAPTSDTACQVFHNDGGGMTYAQVDKAWLDNTVSGTYWGEWYFPANTCVQGIGSSGTGTGCNSDSDDNEDIIAFLPYVRDDVCTQINKVLNVNPSAEIGDSWASNDAKFTGTMSDDTILNQSGLIAGCLTDSNGSHFFQVLKAR